jgi:hypothetical protein
MVTFLVHYSFKHLNESGGTDAITVAAAIVAEADSAFDAATNQTDMVFKLGSSACDRKDETST